jgi:hypothetical protein
MLVSRTSFTSPPLGPNRVHLSLDLFHRHRFAWLSTDRIEHVAKFRGSFAAAQFGGKQVADRRRFQQPVSLGGFNQRLRQIQLNRNAHTTHNMPATGRTCQPGKLPLLMFSPSITP